MFERHKFTSTDISPSSKRQCRESRLNTSTRKNTKIFFCRRGRRYISCQEKGHNRINCFFLHWYFNFEFACSTWHFQTLSSWSSNGLLAKFTCLCWHFSGGFCILQPKGTAPCKSQILSPSLSVATLTFNISRPKGDRSVNPRFFLCPDFSWQSPHLKSHFASAS